MIRLPGAMRLITAWQIPTHSFPSPKSVSNTIGRASGMWKILRRSVREEHCRAFALHAYVEAQRAVLGLRHQCLAVRVRKPGEDGIRLVRLVREVDARQLVAQQSARKHVDVEARRLTRSGWRLRDREGEAALRVGAAAAPAAAVPDLDHAVGDRDAFAVEEPADQLHGTGVRARRELVVGPAAEADLVVRPDRLRRRRVHEPSKGVERMTMSHSYASAHSGCAASRSKRATSSSRELGSRTELKMGSNGKSGSPGKYICVTSRCVKRRPKSEKWMCAGRQAFSWFPHGYDPGLTVTKR